MNYFYQVEVKIERPFFLFKPEKNITIGIFLSSDVGFSEREDPFYLETIEDVLRGKYPYYSLFGNSHEVTIYPKISKIEDLFPEDEEIEVSCTIQTAELKKLLILWPIEVGKFKKIKKNIAFKSLDSEHKIYCFLASIYHQFVDNFDQLLDQYLLFETEESRTQLLAAIEQFLKSDQSIETKNEYIQLCADAVDFDQLQITPIAWLEIIVNYIKNSKHCSQNGETTVST